MIFLDLDGVCCDFVSHVLSYCGKTEQDLLDEMAKDPNIHPYDHFENVTGYKGTRFWRWMGVLGEEMWATIPAFPWFHYMYDSLKEFSEVKFLTAAPLCHNAYSGKAKWIEKNLSRNAMSDLIICNSKSKYLLAGPGRFLIDDTDKNIIKWREVGGKCYHFPSIQFFKRHPTNNDINEAISLAKQAVINNEN